MDGATFMEDGHIAASANQSHVVRILLAGILLNIGLFPVLYIVSPIVAGAIVGLLTRSNINAFAAGFVSAFVAIMMLFGALVIASVFFIETPSLIVGSSLMGALGGGGGLVGALIAKRFPQDRPA